MPAGTGLDPSIQKCEEKKKTIEGQLESSPSHITNYCPLLPSKCPPYKENLKEK